MKRLLEVFALFVNEHPEVPSHETEKIAEYLQLLMDSDPEKVVLRQALQYYANEFNWPYEMHSPDGIMITGMDIEEATQIAKQALDASDNLKREIMQTMVHGTDSQSVLQAHVRAG